VGRTIRLCVAIVAASAAVAGAPVAAQNAAGELIVTSGPVQDGSMQAVGYAPDFDAGCRSTLFSSLLVIETATGSAFGIVHGACGVQWTSIPAGSCRSNLPARPGFTCSHSAGGVTRFAFTGSSQPLRDFGFAEIDDRVWFQAGGLGAGAG